MVFKEQSFILAKVRIISENQTPLFERLVSSLVDGVHIFPYDRGKIWEFGHIVLRSNLKKYNELDKRHNVENKLKELANSQNGLHTKEKLNGWLKKFDEFKKILEPHFDQQQEQEAKKLEMDIIEYVNSQFKYNNLLKTVFAIGGYCLFKKKPEYIRYLWEYKQPPDSDALWTGHDIVPNTINGLINLYFKKGFSKGEFDFWEGHHGSEIYYKQYFLLLLARTLRALKREEIENYNLSKLNIHLLSGLEYSIDEFVQIAKNLKEQTEILDKIGFNTARLDELFDNRLLPFLKSLKTKAQEEIKSLQRKQCISSKRVSEFKAQVLKGFNESTIIRNIFKHYKLYKDRTNEKWEGSSRRFGINRVDSKGAFFDEWYVDYGKWGVYYGRDLASGENLDLLNQITANCKEIKESQFEQTLGKFNNLSDIIIFATKETLYSFFGNSKNFLPKWHKNSPQLDLKSFEGWYLFKGLHIPIFEIPHRIGKQIFILNKLKLGTLLQYSPLNKGESNELKKDIFYMNVQVFSENQELMDKFIQEPPEWLNRIGSEEKQKQYLCERVLISIFERFAYRRAIK